MTDLPIVEPPPDPSVSVDRVAGVLLAAGTSSRFGGANKLLEPVDGRPIVRHAAAGLLEAGLDPVLVVVGHERERVQEALAPLDVRLVENPDYADGQATSVRAGIEALPEAVDAAVFALGDMPWVRASTVEALVAAYRGGAGTALAAAYKGERGNPVLWDAPHFPALARGSGDTGGRDLLLSTDGAALVETGDPGVRRDVDRPADLPGN
jgi:molybdenum cofactor cytidylyltransferase